MPRTSTIPKLENEEAVMAVFDIVKIGDNRLSSTSQKTYTYHMRKLNHGVQGDIWNKQYPPLDLYTEYLKTLRPTTRMPITFAVMRWCKNRPEGCSDELYTALQSVADRAVREREEARPDPNIATETQLENMVDWADVKACLNDRRKQLKRLGIMHGKGTIPSNSLSLLRMWVVGSLYAGCDEQPPRRLEYRSCRVISKEEYEELPEELQNEGNYLVVKSRNKKQWVLNDYKTAHRYGKYVCDVPGEINTALNTWLKFNNTQFLFGENETSRQTFSNWIMKCFAPTKRLVSVNMLRHSYLSSKYAPDAQARETDARRMAHSTGMQIRYVLREGEQEEM